MNHKIPYLLGASSLYDFEDFFQRLRFENKKSKDISNYEFRKNNSLDDILRVSKSKKYSNYIKK